MSATINVESFGALNLKEQAQLDDDWAAAATTATLKSTQGLSSGSIIYVGMLGSEVCERLVINAPPTATTISVTSGPGVAHDRFEPVTAVFGDQVKLYRAANVDGSIPDDADFAAVGSPVSIDPDQTYTEITDSSGSSDYWYKYTYRNSASTAETDLADSVAARGDDYGHYAALEDIRSEAGLSNADGLADIAIDRHRLAAEAEINGKLAGSYTVPFATPTPELVRAITIKLAAGLLLLQDYGPVTEESTKDGKTKVKEARDMLAQIQAHTTIIFDYLGNSLLLSSALPSSWPNETTADADPEDGGSVRMFRASDVF